MSQSDGLIGHSEQAPEPEGRWDPGSGGRVKQMQDLSLICVNLDLHTDHTSLPRLITPNQSSTPPIRPIAQPLPSLFPLPEAPFLADLPT